MKKLKVALTVVLLMSVAMLSACGSQASGTASESSGDAQPADALTLKSADVVSVTSPYTKGMEKLSELVSAETNGRITIKHFPAGQLGNDSQIVEGVKLGSIDIGMVGTINSKVTEALYLPFLFENSEHMNAVLKGEIGEKLKQRFEEETGIKMIGFVYYAPRVLTTKGKEIRTPEDLKGFKIRVPEMATMIDTWKALGASPTPIAFTELFTSLQQGVVDGQENPYEIIANNSLYEVQDVVVETYHALPVRFLIMNKQRYDSLSAEEQQILQKKWDEVSAYIEELYKAEEVGYIQKLKDNGMKFIKPDVEAFREATKDVWKKYAPEAFGEGVYEEIQALRKNK
ncbi:TRAP transporter substrate-binding protein [Brevibacillus marinus]|uniref:TRAP transporter substrate-binding protein n=1 Tax=Brevibacillus marinus TaxID=2496837 RepID=UPI000F8247E3|nr:TRAP transporter substrate-binding protein [Brevibacillus marinus]